MKIGTLVLCLLIHCATLNAQGDVKWTKTVCAQGEVIFLVPGDFLVDNEDEAHRIYAYQDEVSIRIVVKKNRDAKSKLSQVEMLGSSNGSDKRQFSLNDYVGYVFSTPFTPSALGYSNDQSKNFSMFIVLVSSKAKYTLNITSKEKNSPVLVKFLHAIRIKNTPLFKQTNPDKLEEELAISMDSLKTNPVVLQALRQNDGKKRKSDMQMKMKKRN